MLLLVNDWIFKFVQVILMLIKAVVCSEITFWMCIAPLWIIFPTSHDSKIYNSPSVSIKMCLGNEMLTYSLNK